MAPTETTPLAESSAKAVTKAGVNATAAIEAAKAHVAVSAMAKTSNVAEGSAETAEITATTADVLASA